MGAIVIEAATTPPEDDDVDIHVGINCNRCGMDPIRGERFKCSVCEDFDLCETCYERKTKTTHDPSHRFFRQKCMPVSKIIRAPPPVEKKPPPIPPAEPNPEPYDP